MLALHKWVVGHGYMRDSREKDKARLRSCQKAEFSMRVEL